MGIRVNCPSCNKQLNVKSFLAGKRGVCPDCHTKFEIPSGSEHNVILEVEESENTLAARRADLHQQEEPISLPIDFAANAASLGARVIRAEGREQVAAALTEARAADRTTVVVIEVDPSVRVPGYESWWDVPVAEVSESERVRETRRAYDERRAGERWFL